MSRKTKYMMFLSIALSLLLVLTSAALASNRGLTNQGAEAAEFSATISSNVGDGAAPVPLKVEGPTRAKVGDTVTFTVVGDGATDLSGFQFALQYDPAGLIFYKATLSDELVAMDADILKVGPVRNENTVFFGGLTCPVADCTSVDYQQPRIQPSLSMANAPLVNFYFYVRSGGSYSLSLKSAQLVRENGSYVLAGDQKPLLQPESASVDALDLTHNGFINDSDVWAAVGIWGDLTPQGSCTTPALSYFDLNQSGCIDVADMQLILSHWGEPTSRFPNWVPKPSSVTDTTFTVNSTGDGPDSNLPDGVCSTAGGECTLRAAIEQADALAGKETINFDITGPGGSCPSLVILQPATTLLIDDPAGDGLIINGYTQCDAKPNDQPITGNAVIKIEIMGNQTAGLYGLEIHSPYNVIKGLAIYDWNYQILIHGSRAHDNSIEGNFLGTNAANTHTNTNFPGESDGIRIDLGSSNNTIGGAGGAWDKRNLISGNGQDGLGLQSSDVQENKAIGNYIGLKQDGVTALRNSSDGVDIAGGAHNNQIGGLNSGERNVISGNNHDGVELSHDGVNNNEVVGNFIGLNATGSGITPNRQKGVTFEDDTPNNKVYRNIIAGNWGYGVRFQTASSSELSDNFIGVYPQGLESLGYVVPIPSSVSFSDLVAAPNGAANNSNDDVGIDGIFMYGGSQSNQILRNIIAYHPRYGIHLSAKGSYIGPSTCGETYNNTFSQNMLFENGSEGIKFSSAICDDGVTHYPNQNREAPVITSATTAQVSGTACANCTVEVFISDKTSVQDPSGDNNGEGKIYLTTGTADGGGNFSIPVNGVSVDQLVTATSTDAAGNTSPFALNVKVVEAPPLPTPTNTPTGTLTVTPEPTPTQTPTPPTPIVAGPYIINLPIVIRESR